MSELPDWPWAEVAPYNEERAAELSNALFALVAFSPAREPKVIGTAFAIAAEQEFTLALTAKHVVDSIAAAQAWGPRSAASSLFAHEARPDIDDTRLKAMRLGSTTGDVWNVVYANYNESTDIAVLLLLPQDGEARSRLCIPLDTAVPEVGDIVHLVSQNQMAATEHIAPETRDGKGQVFSIARSMSIRVGKVTGVHQDGLRQFRWPAFTTTIPAEPGMSGGFVFLPGEGLGKTISACGIISSDFSDTAARTNQKVAGESLIASSWPALGLRVPPAIPWKSGDPAYTLIRMIDLGRLVSPIGGTSAIKCIEGPDDTLTLWRSSTP
jgi:hypothetical protein